MSSQEQSQQMGWDEFDPRKEVFQAPTNSYTYRDTPFSFEETKAATSGLSSTENTKVLVQRIPLQLNENGLRNLFSRVGEVKGARFIRKSRAYPSHHRGVVDFLTARDAENSIARYHGFKIGCYDPLLVSVYKDAESMEAKRLQRQRDEEELEKLKLLPGFKEYEVAGNEETTEPTEEEEDFFPADSRMTEFSGDYDEETSGAVLEKNVDQELWTVDIEGKISVQVLAEGQKPSVPQEEDQEILVTCDTCRKRCKYSCACKKAFYCGRDCQEAAWKNHRNFCSMQISS